jgi:3-methyladenine DNA glycosylase AlkD
MRNVTFWQAHQAVLKQRNVKRAQRLKRFFKTKPGEYGYGDIFIGLNSAQIRKLAKMFMALSFDDIARLLRSKIHEERQLALFILVNRYKTNTYERQKIYRFYLQNIKFVNSWDLVDLSAHKIIGWHLAGRSITPLNKLVSSPSLWQRRIAVVATLQFIRHGNYNPTLKQVKRLLTDSCDLIQKACGWMLREVGKRDITVLRRFLKRHYRAMPKPMLRYAIERLPETERRQFLAKHR